MATSVLPSPVFISAMMPSLSTMPPTSCTSKWRRPIERLAASRQAAKASGQQVVEVLAGFEPGAELGRLARELGVAERLHLGLERVDRLDARVVLAQLAALAQGEELGQDVGHGNATLSGVAGGSNQVVEQRRL